MTILKTHSIINGRLVLSNRPLEKRIRLYEDLDAIHLGSEGLILNYGHSITPGSVNILTDWLKELDSKYTETNSK